MNGVSSSRLPLLCLTIVQFSFYACSFAADPQSPDAAKVIRDLSYVTNGHERQRLDLYLPKRPEGPLVVWIHGGGWRSQTRADVEVLQSLTSGYAVASLDYRCSQDAVFPAQIEDCKAAVRWLRAHASEYGYDPKRIGAMGAIDEKMDLARRASPAQWVTKEAAPLYLLHGAKDPAIPLEQSHRLADKLKGAGVEVTLDVVDGGGHGGEEFWTVDRSKCLAEFLNRHLRR